MGAHFRVLLLLKEIHRSSGRDIDLGRRLAGCILSGVGCRGITTKYSFLRVAVQLISHFSLVFTRIDISEECLNLALQFAVVASLWLLCIKRAVMALFPAQRYKS